MGLSGHNYACEGSTKLAVKTKEDLQKGGSIEPMEPPLDPPLDIVAELVASRQAKYSHHEEWAACSSTHSQQRYRAMMQKENTVHVHAHAIA